MVGLLGPTDVMKMRYRLTNSPMRESWDRCLERARQLARADEAVSPLLTFYAALLELQCAIASGLTSGGKGPPTGELTHDLELLRPGIGAFLESMATQGPELLATQARRLIDGPQRAIDDLLTTCWNRPNDRQFFAKAVLQPYARFLAEAGVMPLDRALTMSQNRCPFCGGTPQLGILHGAGPLEGGGRSLLCATCLTVWPFRRVLCAFCGEEDEPKLAYFHSPPYEHLRVDACETCRRYMKTVDLTTLGLAVPLVDEVAGAALDIWAQERGYEKIELNLVGL
jgi:FdhE protein